MSDERAIKLVCFDLGGVVVRICQSWDEGCARAGVESRVTPEELAKLMPSILPVNHAYECGETDLDEYARAVERITGGRHSAEEIKRIQARWIIGAYPGVVDVVERLHAAGVETATLSNTTHHHWVELERMPTIAAITHRHASHLLGVRKPDAAAYRAIEERTRRAGEEILFFDDLEDNIEAARAAGWDAVRIDPLVECTSAQMNAALVERGLLDGRG
jgi:putative hydrolase of the HAD superfamily